MNQTLWNDNWLYWRENNAFALMWNVNEEAEKVTLPHDAMIYEQPFEGSINGGNSGFRDSSVYYYSKNLYASEEMRAQTVMLHFEGVYMNAQVYVNSEFVKACNYGYTGFYVKLDDYLKYGEDNEIRVIVRNSGMPNSRWYSGGGIYRDVYLLTAGEIYLRADGCRITTESVDDGVGVIRVESTVVSRMNNRNAINIQWKVFDADGTVVASEMTPAALFEREERVMPVRFAIEDAKLWNDEHPYLYTLETALVAEDGSVLDSASERFGIRTLALDAKRGLRVNGKTVKLAGACIHHDNGLVGAATYYDFHYRQMKKLKELGFNAIRMSHNPAAPALLRACDELGMYVMDEAFDMWTRCKTSNDYAIVFEKCWEDDVEAMVRKDYNHPSVVMYSLGNEIPEIGTSLGARYAMRLADKIRSIDKTRFTLTSVNALFAVGHLFGQIMADVVGDQMEVDEDGNVNEIMTTLKHIDQVLNHPLVDNSLAEAAAATDMLGYNYMTPRYLRDAKELPNRVMVGSETYATQITENWPLVNKIDSLIGDFVWTGWDYIGESGIGIPSYDRLGDGFGTPFPCIMAYSGDVDITGFVKPAGRLAAIVFGAEKNPHITTQSPAHYHDFVNKTPWALTIYENDWTYPGHEGELSKVEVYSAGDEVELLINGKSLGKKPAGEAVGNITAFEVPYEAGTLTAVTYEKGVEIGRSEVKTVVGDAKLSVEVEEATREGRLVYINIEKKDAAGTLCYEGDEEISVTCDDNAVCFIGSGDHSPILTYTSGKTKLFHGRAQVVVVKSQPSDCVSVTVNGVALTV